MSARVAKKDLKGKSAPVRVEVDSEEQLLRVRRICSALPGTMEKLSHGEPTFFVGKKVYAMFANNHHNDGHVAIWIPTAPGSRAALIKSSAQKFFFPPYVGVKGWVGIELESMDDDELGFYVSEAWKMIAPKKALGTMRTGSGFKLAR